MAATTVGHDDLVPPQNNGTLVYRLLDGKWFFMPHAKATCFAVAQTISDVNELMMGIHGNKIVQEDITEVVETVNCDWGQQTKTAEADPKLLTDNTKDWATDEWKGADIFIQPVEDADGKLGGESVITGEVASNDGTTITLTAPLSLYGVEYCIHKYDYYFLKRDSSPLMTLYYKSPKLAITDANNIKQFIRFFTRALFDGELKIKWEIDDGNNGMFNFNLSHGATHFGYDENENSFNYGSTNGEVTENTLCWEDTIDQYVFKNMVAGSKGRYIQFEIAIETSSEFRIDFLGLAFKQHGEGGWQ
jgi:hypothetical protein